VSYALTDVGRGFRDVADAISRWGKAVVAAQAGAATASRAKHGRRVA
jgi:DNA-binding HxlR family transcriptional regulator